MERHNVQACPSLCPRGLCHCIVTGAVSPPLAQQPSLTLFAAASMKNALDDVNAAFTKQTGIKTVASYAATSALMRQIEQGAPADIFASADLEWMDYGLKNKLINPATRVNLLGNRLVLIAPKGFQDRHRDARAWLRPRQARRRRPHRHRRSEVGAGRALRHGGAAEARHLGVGRKANGHGRERARRAHAGRARRGRARHRLRDRRQGGAGREDRRALPGRFASCDRLSGRRDRQSQARSDALHRFPAVAGCRSRYSRNTASASW